MIYNFEKSVLFFQQAEAVFLYHANVNNIAKLVPEHVRVEVLSAPVELKLLDKVKLKIYIYLFSFTWESKITGYEPNKIFIDELARGPFSSWKHYHIFAAQNGKTLMTDKIEYKLPFGIFGKIINNIFVRKQLEQIFIIRHKMAQIHLAGKITD